MEFQFIFFVLMGVTSILCLVILIKLFLDKSAKATDVSAQLLDLKNQLTELKTKQLEAQNAALQNQQDNLNKLINTINTLLTNSQRNIIEQLNITGKVVGDINEKLGILEETSKNMQEIGKDISSLQDILSAPKLRGNIGEFLLEELLKQILPAKNYQMQYPFKNGSIVDAVIRLGDHIIPVDSKFPLTDFQRIIESKNEEEKKKYKRAFVQNLKRKINEIREKYINPDEGTYDFALMYIPAENVFYEIIINDSLSEGKEKDYEIFNYALNNRIIPVSPNSFYSYLMAIVYGLKGLRIEQQAKEILNGLSTLQEMIKKFYHEYNNTGKYLKNANKAYENSIKELSKFNNRISLMTGLEVELLENNE
ncbi:MAG: DNA recombination protein RmuC [Spirochaetes bacterium]|nr:DNA recombination protein RmuC [Spirochaetota bacterium]